MDTDIWGYRSSNSFSPEELIDELAENARTAAANWELASINLETATDFDHAGYQRVYVEIPITTDLFDAFFNAHTGYRAHYAISEAAGERFNSAAVAALGPIILSLEDRFGIGLDRMLCERSLAGPHTKLWFPKSVSDPVAEPWLATLEEVIGVPAWQDWWREKTGPRKGLLAPQPEEPAILLNGTFFGGVDDLPWNQKPYRSADLHSRGWT